MRSTHEDPGLEPEISKDSAIPYFMHYRYATFMAVKLNRGVVSILQITD